MTFSLGLTGKRAVIVGGARGIGRANAELLVGEGAEVASAPETQIQSSRR